MSDDLIRRQDAIDALTDMNIKRNFDSVYDGEMNRTRRAAQRVIAGLPSAQPEKCEDCGNFNKTMFLIPQPKPQWIPCSERLPEEDVEVLISYRYKEGEGDTSHVNVDITSYGQMYFGGRKVAGEKYWRPPFEYFSSNYEIIAWMPLPEPWGGERE